MSSEVNTTCQPKDSEVGNVFLMIFLMVETLVGIPGSIMAIWIFCCRMESWKSHVTFLFNLCLADLLLFLSVPFRIDSHWRGDDWNFGPVWCRINLYMLSVNRSASISFMTAVALDRYFKVVHPYHSVSRLLSRHAHKFAALIWLIVVLYRIPLLTTNLLHTDHKTGKKLCRSFHSYKVIPLEMKVHYVAYILEFFLPLFLLVFCSVRIACQVRKLRMDKERIHQVIRAVMVIIAVFTFCFLPGVFSGLVSLYINIYHQEACESYEFWINLFKVCIGFTYLNSALDSVIYIFSSSVFHRKLKNSFRWRRTPEQLVTYSS
ncbi:hydroxycarboxylic acid receptor 2-like [Cyprinodon tularosa]|uniref:hydroxycarboxylic acid receptor 2-like n=1 Tax=Cyprinodon tularosa TaxID=77115 RepID=UPI0018E22B25|nr:hydroxycarboxylic acid receptor 2-like [Cyprinodon tularosa]